MRRNCFLRRGRLLIRPHGDGRVEVAYGPVALDDMTMRAVLHGRLPPKGGNMPRELPGGGLADRVPKA